MIKRSFDEMISYFNRTVADMDIDQKYKMILLGIITAIGQEHEATTPYWIPVTERLPDDLAEVNITFINTDPESYYQHIKGKAFTGSAVFYKGDWYWYSSVTQDVLAEYGTYESEKLDDALTVTAWMPLPEAYKGDN